MMSNAEFSTLRQQAGLTLQAVADTFNRPLEIVSLWEKGTRTPNQKVLALLKRSAEHAAQTKEAAAFTFVDLFAGIGGIRQGIEAAGGKCIFTSEWSPYARQTYMANFACNHPFPADITQVPVHDIPPHNLLVGGFPCQPFSIAGISKKNALGRPHGFADAAQGTLFFDVARILEHHQPQAFLLENVKNLESHDKGNTFQIIQDTLTGLGYSIHWRIINGKGFVPQNRARIFIAGFREKTDFDFAKLFIPAPHEGPTMQAVLHPEDGSETAENPYTAGPLARVNPKYTLSAKLWDYLQAYAIKHKQRGNGFGFGLVGPHDKARTLSARYYKDGSEILVKQKGSRPRRLTPRECARLMGFDSSFEIPVSDTQAYKQFGNSVVVPVVETIAHHLQPFLNRKSR